MPGTGAETVLLATLGTEAQVVTSAWLLLHREGAAVREIEVFYTQAPPILEARRRLESVTRPGWPRVRFTLLGEDAGHPLADVLTEGDVQAAFRTFYHRLKDHNVRGCRVHFLIAGGRKPLALYAVAAAQLLFDDYDRLWHLYSEPAFLESRRLFPEPHEDVRLIPIPVLPWHCMLPAVSALEHVDAPWQAVALARKTALEEKYGGRGPSCRNTSPEARRAWWPCWCGKA